ncbi:hypothetical protein [Enterobacter sp. KBR-315C3_2022]|uniref:hypothetical protein n=1 Tax=Enterobacter sp. KBR-315C3_2022 TaxID=3242494 RepID=UPI00352722E7
MLENVYFWKNKNGGGGALNIIIIALVLIVLCAAGGGGGWYYFVKIPADQQAEQKQREIQERQSNIASVKDYYAKSLSGADFDKAIAVLGEIRKGIYPIDSLMSLESRSFSCDNKKCNLNLKLDKDALLTQPELIFWDKPYKASVPIAKKGKNEKYDLEYSNLDSKMTGSKILAAYKSGSKDLGLYSCNDIMSYVNTYNSLVKRGKGGSSKNTDEMLVIKSAPNSKVADLEKTLVGSVKRYDMLSGSWEMTTQSSSSHVLDMMNELNLQTLLYKQAYKDAFLVNKIETLKNGIKVSGGLVCKG